MTINGGEFVAENCGVEVRSGTVAINGGEFTARMTPTDSTPNGNGTTTEGAAIGIVQHTIQHPISVTITGGVFNACTPVYEKNTQSNPEEALAITLSITDGTFNVVDGNTSVFSEDCQSFITGGTFSIKPDDKYLSEGYSSENTGSEWVVSKCDGTLVYGENSFERRAITSIGGYAGYDDDSALILSGNMKLMADLTTEHITYVPEGAEAVLDLNGHTIESRFMGYSIGNFGTLTINDSTAIDGEKGTGIIYNSSKTRDESNFGHDAIRNFGTLTINGGTFGDADTDETNENDTTYAAALRNLGTAIINGGYKNVAKNPLACRWDESNRFRM